MSTDGGRRRTALVTGGAAGLGASFVEVFARNGYDVILVDRQERVRGRAEEIARRHGVTAHAIVLDLTDPRAARTIEERCRELERPVDVLVNNAGFQLNRHFRELPWSAVAGNLRLMLDGVVELTHAVLPGMIERGWGRVLNVSSISGLMPGGPMLTTYASAKSFLVTFSEALSFELEGTGVAVTALCPGFIRTDLFVNSGVTDVRDRVPGFLWSQPEDVAEDGFRAVMRGTPVRVSGVQNRLIATASKLLPRALLRARSRVLRDPTSAKETTTSSASGGRRPFALVTGARAGIGASVAELAAQKGHDVVLVARRKDILERRAADLARRFGVAAHVVVADLADRDAPEALKARCDALGLSIDLLVNNAGFPITELFHRMSSAQVDAALQVLVRSVLHLTHLFLPPMIARRSGHVINVASMAGFEPGSYRSSLYASSKAAVIAFSESLDAELRGTGVHATAVCPGFTRTEWTSKNELSNDSIPRALWMDADEVARRGWAAAQRGEPVSVIGTPALRAVSVMFGLAPRRLVGRMLSERRRRMWTRE